MIGPTGSPTPINQQHASEDVAEDDTCPVCRLLLFEPVQTACSHVLCQSCMAQWAQTTSSVEMDVIGLDPTLGPGFDELMIASCPMCRRPTGASLDEELGGTLESRYPTTYAARRAEETARQEADNDAETMILVLGNEHSLASTRSSGSYNNNHKWTFFVRTSRMDLIEEHPTFRQNRIILKHRPFEISRIGWGTFPINTQIVLKEPYTWDHAEAGSSSGSSRRDTIAVEWMLDFRGRGSLGRNRLRIRRWDGDDASTEGATVMEVDSDSEGDMTWEEEDSEDYTASDEVESSDEVASDVVAEAASEMASESAVEEMESDGDAVSDEEPASDNCEDDIR